MSKKKVKVRGKLIRKHPIIGSILVIFLYYLLAGLVPILTELLPPGLYLDYLNEFTYMAIAFLMVVFFGFKYTYHKGNFKKTLRALSVLSATQIFLAFAIIANVFYTPTEWKAPLEILLGFILLFEIGFCEESIFRGIIVNAFYEKHGYTKKGIWFTVIASGIIFGSVHLINYFAGVTLVNTLIQSLNAIMIGIYFAAAYLCGQSLWAMIVVHTLIDFNGLFESAFTQNVTSIDSINNLDPSSLITGVILMFISFYLLRDSKMNEILKEKSDI